MVNIRVTDKDLEILSWTNKMRYVTCRQVQKKFGLKQSWGYERLSRLVKEGYLAHKRIFIDKPGVYYCTGKGVQSGDNLKPIKRRISLNTYEHNLIVVDISIELEKQGKWISDREFMRQKNIKNRFTEDFHAPDGILILPQGKRVAIEVELTQKSHRALEKILKKHRRSTDYDEVWYLVPNKFLFDFLIRETSKEPEVKVRMIKDILKET